MASGGKIFSSYCMNMHWYRMGKQVIEINLHINIQGFAAAMTNLFKQDSKQCQKRQHGMVTITRT
jgi:hypothetical protein